MTTPRKKAPEITFQQHIADFLVYEHGYGVLEQTEITNTEHFIGRGPGRFFGGKGLLNAEWRMRSAARVEERVSGEAVKEDVPDFVALQCGP